MPRYPILTYDKAQGGIAGFPTVRAQSLGSFGSYSSGIGVTGATGGPAGGHTTGLGGGESGGGGGDGGGTVTTNFNTGEQLALTPGNKSAPPNWALHDAMKSVTDAYTNAPTWAKIGLGTPGLFGNMLANTLGLASISGEGYTSEGSPGGQLIDTRYRDYPQGNFPENEEDGVETNPEENLMPIIPMNTGGMIQDAMRLQAAGTGPHNQLVHMTQGEVDAMNALAGSGIGGLRSNGMAINPQTGLPEAGFFSSILPALAGIGLTIASGGTAAPWALGLASGAGSLVGQKLEGGEVDVGKAFLAGLGGWGAGQLGRTFGAAGAELGAGGAANVGVEQAAVEAGKMGAEPFSQALQSTAPQTFAQYGGPLQVDAAGRALTSVGASGTPGYLSTLAQGVSPEQLTKIGGLYGTGGSEAAMSKLAEQSYLASPDKIGLVKSGLGTLDPTQWASTPGTVGLKETLAPGAALAASTADAFGAFDPPEYNWDNEYPDTYDYQGPYLPRPRTAFAPPAGYQPGIDPAYQYYSYGNKGGYVGGLPTIRAITGYGQQQQPKSSPATDMLAAAGAANTGLGAIAQPKGLGFYTTDPRMALRNQLAQAQARPQQVAPVPRQDPLLTAGLTGQRQPILPGQMPGQQMFARHGGYANDLPTVRMQGKAAAIPSFTDTRMGRNEANQERLRAIALRDVLAKQRAALQVPMDSRLGEVKKQYGGIAGLPTVQMQGKAGVAAGAALADRIPDKGFELPYHLRNEPNQPNFVWPGWLTLGRERKMKNWEEFREKSPGERKWSESIMPRETKKMREEQLKREELEDRRRRAKEHDEGWAELRRTHFSQAPYRWWQRWKMANRGSEGPGMDFPTSTQGGIAALWRRLTEGNAGQREPYDASPEVRELMRQEALKKEEAEMVPSGMRIEEPVRKQFGGVAGEPVNIATSGLMEGAAPEIQAAVAERDMVTPAPDQPQNAEERAIFDQALLALQGELSPPAEEAAIIEFVDTFGPEALEQLQALVSGERENGGIVKPANGQDTVGMSEMDVRLANQGPDVIQGMIVDPQTGKQTANLRVGEDEYIMPADGLEREAKSAGLPPTAKNGAMVVSEREEQLRRAYG